MATLSQRSFAGGEIAPSLGARVDTTKYSTGLRACRNSIVMRHGGTMNRPGFRFVCEVKDSSRKVRLVEFIFSNDQTYVLEFGHQYMRVIKNGAQVLSGGIPYEIATAYTESQLSAIQYVQSGNVVTIVHPDHPPRDLRRTHDTSWSLTDISFVPSIAAPATPSVVNNTGGNGFLHSYVATAVRAETYEESVPSPVQSTIGLRTLDAEKRMTISFGTVAGAVEYNIYKQVNGVFSWLGVATATHPGTVTFDDIGGRPDTADTPPTARNPFVGIGNYPSTVAYYQQRRGFANTYNSPEKIWFSRTGRYNNFTTASPLQADDAVTFELVSRQVNAVKHMLDLGRLVVLTDGGEWSSDAVLTPSQINAKQSTYNGSSNLKPLILGGNALYVQARGSIVRDFGFDFAVDGYRGNDLTIFAAHLFDEYTLVDWSYQQTPHSVVWAARSDGTLLGLTYVREHNVWGWHRHDTDGAFENTCVIPSSSEETLYVVARRTINGVTKRYIEMLAPRKVVDVIDNVFMDSARTYDGRNRNLSHTMTLSGGATWVYSDVLTCTSSISTFSSGDIGNAIHFTTSDGDIVRFTIEGFTSGTVVTGRAHKTVPVAFRSTATSSWTRAIKTMTGLSHLEGKQVSVFADRHVVASPNNPEYTTRTVTSGQVTLDKAYGVIHVGLPYLSDIQTLDIDTPNSETISDKKMVVSSVTLHLEKSRGVFVGGVEDLDLMSTPTQDLTELKMRTNEGYDDPVALFTGKETLNIQPQWNSNGRVLVRQIDPLPISVLAIAPAGLFPFKG